LGILEFWQSLWHGLNNVLGFLADVPIYFVAFFAAPAIGIVIVPTIWYSRKVEHVLNVYHGTPGPARAALYVVGLLDRWWPGRKRLAAGASVGDSHVVR
jgi:hypothetical protein